MAIHPFTPTHFHTTIGWHEPVLRIADGDTIVTRTVDARGADHTNTVITPGGNPMTGPFYVEGAELGDTLAVHFDELTPNRDTGWTLSTLASNVIDPDYIREVPYRIGDISTWTIDRAGNTATLSAPGTKMDRFTVKLSPMVGCFGVAPPGRQAISTATSGPFGGNMDYRHFVAGTTVYFPVFAPGALFHLGDGHAVQGDGEIVGTGIEISFDVKFTLRLIRRSTIHWPRGENDEYIFTVGNARPLDQCVQHATTEMLRWLNSDYGYNTREASLLLGQTVRYDLGNVYDPAYTMVCKLPKAVLK
jgi:acetamidase/formamidase